MSLYFIYLKGSPWGLGYSDDGLLEELEEECPRPALDREDPGPPVAE